MKSYSKILFLLLTTVLILTLFSCGDNNIETPNQTIDTQATDETESIGSIESDNTTSTDVDESSSDECEHIYEEKVLISATCTKEGITKKTCTVCNKTQSVNVPKLDHTEVTDKGFDATCTASGLSDGKHCSICNTVIIAQKPIAPLGHTEVIDKAVTATCATTGKTEGKHCSVCNTITVAQTTIAAFGHSEIVDEAIPATCTIPGKTEGKHCSVCNTITVAQTTIAAFGHSEIVDEAIPATCTTPGKTEGKHCSVCNTITVAQTTIAAFGHSIINRTFMQVTCQSNGSIEKYCTKCELVLGYETIPKGHYSINHEYANITHPQIGNLCKGFKAFCQRRA